MDYFDDHQAEAIARDWEVDVGDLEALSWILEEREGNDGHLYGYLVRFDANNDVNLMRKVGVDANNLTREVGLNAFDDDNADEGIYPLNEPFPDLFADYDDEEDEDQSSFASEEDFVERLQLQSELIDRLEKLESLLNQVDAQLPARGHNNPPEMIEDGPYSSGQMQAVMQVVRSMQSEAQKFQPNVESLAEKTDGLKAFADRLLAWFKQKADLTVDTTIKWGVPDLPLNFHPATI
ncbi:hypothetical protein [Celeribacter sp.]|uniref:hypothetical protein n=1 Tax=Celeribacter sp. TaxID=1890673 RepID=UPI003A93B570